jgi:hypothetical protein
MVAALDKDTAGGLFQNGTDTFAAWWGQPDAPWVRPPDDAYNPDDATGFDNADNPAQWKQLVWAEGVLLNADDDADGDMIPDAWETNTGTYTSPDDTGTDPNSADSDGDGVNDGEEVLAGFDPTARRRARCGHHWPWRAGRAAWRCCRSQGPQVNCGLRPCIDHSVEGAVSSEHRPPVKDRPGFQLSEAGL